MGLEEKTLAEIAPWVGLAPALFAALLAAGTFLASPPVLLTLALIAAGGAFLPFHPFDLIYNHAVRYLTITHPLPRQGAPRRFASALGAACVLAATWAFRAGHARWGYLLGGALCAEEAASGLAHFCTFCCVYVLLFGRRDAPDA